MNTTAHGRPRTHAWALLALLGTLAGCPDAGQDPVGQGPWQSTQLTDPDGRRWLAVWDPEQPADTVRRQAIDDGLLVPAESVDAATGERTALGLAMALYLQDGQLMRLDLHAAERPVATQVSGLSDICRLRSALPLQADGRLAVVEVVRRDASGSCTRDGWMVRSDAGPESQGVGGVGQRLLAVLPDPTGQAVAVLQAMPLPDGAERLAVRTPALGDAQVLAGQPASGGLGAALLAWRRGPAGQAWVGSASQLWRLDWRDATPRLVDASSVTRHGTLLQGVAAGDQALEDEAGHLVLADGDRLVRIGADGTVQVLAALSSSQRVYRLRLTTSQVVWGSVDLDDFIATVRAVPRAGGTPSVIAWGDSSAMSSLLEVSGERVLIHNTGFDGESLSVLNLAGDNTPADFRWVGLHWPARHAAGTPGEPDGLLACERATGPCALRQVDWALQPLAVLGSVTTTDLSLLRGDQTEGLPGAVIGSAGSSTEAWVWSASASGGLTRIGPR